MTGLEVSSYTHSTVHSHSGQLACITNEILCHSKNPSFVIKLTEQLDEEKESLATWASLCLKRPIRLKAKSSLSSEAVEGSVGPCLFKTIQKQRCFRPHNFCTRDKPQTVSYSVQRNGRFNRTLKVNPAKLFQVRRVIHHYSFDDLQDLIPIKWLKNYKSTLGTSLMCFMDKSDDYNAILQFPRSFETIK